MKKLLSLALTLAMLVSAVALTACGDDSATTTGSSPTNKTTAPKKDNSVSTTKATDPAVQTTRAPTQDDLDYDELMKLYRPFAEARVENPEAFIQDSANQNLMLGTSATGAEGLGLFDSMNEELSIWTSFENQEPMNLFDADTFQTATDPKSTKWCASDSENSGASAIVWSMTAPVNVTGYSITTGDDNATYDHRGPINWRLYGCNGDIPTVRMDSVINEEDGKTYFDRYYMVPEGWELVDAVEAMKDGNPMESIFPDENFAEIFIQLPKTCTYQHFMLLIDSNEDNCIQMSSFNLYGTKAE